MGVYKDKSKTRGNRKLWIADVTLKHPDGRELRRKKRARTQEEAKEFERALEVQLTQELYHPEQLTKPKPPTIAVFYPAFMGRYELEKKPTTVAQRKIMFEKYILPCLGSLRVDEVGRRQREDLKQHLRSQGIHEVETLNAAQGALGALLRDAVRQEWIEQVPLGGYLPVPEKEADSLTLLELNALLNASTTDVERAFLLLAGQSGLRVGEILGLFCEDIDFQTMTIKVRRTLWRKADLTPKSNKMRVVAFTVAARDVLLLLVRKKGRLFHKKNKPLWPNSIQRMLDRLCERATLRRITCHTLRHTALTHLSKVTDPHVLQKIAGHAGLEMTQRYVHANALDIRDAIQKLERLQRLPSGPQEEAAAQSPFLPGSPAVEHLRQRYTGANPHSISTEQLLEENPLTEPEHLSALPSPLVFSSSLVSSLRGPQENPVGIYTGEALSYSFLESAIVSGLWSDEGERC